MENKNWEKVINNTWKNLNNGEIEHAFDFKIDLDNYESISCVPGLTEYIRNEVSTQSNGKQVPTSRFENISLDYPIW